MLLRMQSWTKVKIRNEVRLVYHVPRLQSGRNSGSPAGYAVLIVLYIYMLVAHHT